MERCRSAWPGIAVDDEAFAVWLDTRVPDGTPLASVPITDLYLACACAAGNSLAIEQFDEHLLREVAIASAKMRAASGIADEARQVVRELLFVPRTHKSGERPASSSAAGGAQSIDRPPAIHNYAGRGDLRGWVKVIATREVLRLIERDKARREITTDDDSLLEALSPKDDPELEHMKATFRDEFAVAFREAIAELTPRERTLLRHSVVDGLGIEALGQLYKVHRSTAARWLEQARDNLAALTRRRLGTKLRLTEVEVDSVIRLIHSRLDVSIQRHLKK